MSTALIQFYHRLPGPTRLLAANLRGLYLRRWRYGPETERLVEEALARERWSPGQWQMWQEDRLAYVLHLAATKVPYYREQWAARRRRGDRASHEHLENWPILHKESVRANPAAFVAEDCRIQQMYLEHTGGSTGTPLKLWFSRASMRAWYALYEARTRRWDGLSFRQPWAILGGQAVQPPTARRPPFWIWNSPMNQLYLSANHLSPANAPAFLDAMRTYRVTHLISYASSAAQLASAAFNLGLDPPKLQVVYTNSEPLLTWQREIIRHGLKAEVRETYGMAEVVAGAGECEAGVLHVWPETGWLESVHDSEDKPVAPGSPGRLICTGLLNTDMPLVRYEVGDRACSSSDPQAACPCGRTLPVLSAVQGRINDYFVTPDGRQVYFVNPVLYGLPIHEGQLIQETLDRVRVRYVPAPEFTAQDSQTIVDRLVLKMGNVQVILEPVDAIPREANRKCRVMIRKVPPEQLQSVGATSR